MLSNLSVFLSFPQVAWIVEQDIIVGIISNLFYQFILHYLKKNYHHSKIFEIDELINNKKRSHEATFKC